MNLSNATPDSGSRRRRGWGGVSILIACLLISGCDHPSSGNPLGESPATPSGSRPGTTSPPATGIDLSGTPVSPFASTADKAVVLFFLSTECPISNRYAPLMRRLQARFSPLGIRFYVVYPDNATSVDSIAEHLKAYGPLPPALRDPSRALVQAGKVRVTPEAAVFLPGQRLVYHGRIDDRYADLGKERAEPVESTLENVLDALLAGRPLPSAGGRAVGCPIPDLR
ncbi:MAG TPA: hypothetical protein DCM86_16170 [Verrucomicrobiales bacterium]|nr:hypothetical protein [Verrucomicrobiales bacterium]